LIYRNLAANFRFLSVLTGAFVKVKREHVKRYAVVLSI